MTLTELGWLVVLVLVVEIAVAALTALLMRIRARIPRAQPIDRDQDFLI